MIRQPAIDCAYVAASARDARYTRICVASIRHFYPNLPIKLLIGGELERGLAEELHRNWNVGVADLPARDWGWGFVKLEPLFGNPGERFVVLDSDTVCVGDVIKTWSDCASDFLVDDERQSQQATERLYYNWQKVAAYDAAAVPAVFVFNSGQWFGTAGILKRDDFMPWIDWNGARPSLRHTDIFMPGDQGVLNYVMNQKFQNESLAVVRRKIMCWPGHGMGGITADAVAAHAAPAMIVHWAGLKKATLCSMPGADILLYFERRYYAVMAFGWLRRRVRALRYCTQALRDAAGVRLKLRWQKLFGRREFAQPIHRVAG